MRRMFSLAALAAAGIVLSACASSAPASGGASAPVARAPTRPTPYVATPYRPGADAAPGGIAESRGVAQFTQASPVHRTLAAALVQAQLAETLSAAGPFTLFAPTDTAFNAVPVATRAGWLQEANRTQLSGVLNRHLVPGRLTSAELNAQIQAGGGSATLTTVAGERLTVRRSGDRLVVTDSAGRAATVTTGDVVQSNGVVHVVDRVLAAG